MRSNLIRLERTYDFELIRSIITHPRLYPHIASDFHPKACDFQPNTSEAIHYLLAQDGEEICGLCIAHWIHTPVTYEIHHAILPSAWDRTDAIGEAFETWLFQNTLCETAVGFTPACNKLACRYAVRRGLVESGRIPNGYKKNGKLYDLIIYCKLKPHLMV